MPIYIIDFDNPADVAMHGKMLDLQRQLPCLKGEALIATADEKIDGLVYRLYGLSGVEVGVWRARNFSTIATQRGSWRDVVA